MTLSANARPRAVKDKVIHIIRQLNGSGELSCQVGQEVAPHDILGKANLASGYSVINISKRLGSSPVEVQKLLKRAVGSTIFKGELLAEKKGLLSKKAITSPTDGVIDQFNPQTGELRLKFLAKPVPLTSGVYGVIDQVDKEKGRVVVRTQGTVVYGVYGSGEQRGGDLHIIGEAHGIVQASQISQSMYAQILVGGALVYKDALKKAVLSGVQAIITGGLNIADFKAMVGTINPNERQEQDVGFSVLATEGFGALAMGEDIFETLKPFDGKFVFACGNTKRLMLPNGNPDSLIAVRRTVIPVENDPVLLPDICLSQLKVGEVVRLIWPPNMGQQGKIVAIDQTPTLLKSGISTYMVTVETPHKKLKVPFPNLELML